MATYYPSTSWPAQFVNPDTGELLSGGVLRAFVAGSSTPATMYRDGIGTSAGTAITLNAGGYPTVSSNIVVVWLDAAIEYKFTLEDALGASKWTVDNIASAVMGGDSPNLCKTVTDLTDTLGPLLANGRRITSAQVAALSNTGAVIETTWNNTTSKKGGAKYEIKSRAQHRTDIADPAWVPDGYGDHYLMGGTTYVAVLQSDIVRGDQYGMIGNGSAANDDAYAAAAATGRVVNLGDGDYYFAQSPEMNKAGILGQGQDRTSLLFNGTHGITIAADLGLSRKAAILAGFSIESIADSCDVKYAIYIPGVASGAAAVYNSGLNVRNIEIGREGRFGGGFYIKDMFRMSIEDVGMTDVSRMIRVVGSVVQLYCNRVLSNNDFAATALGNIGISTESATYASGVLGPENCTFDNCAYIRGDEGIRHTAGLLVSFNNFDTEADNYGAVVGTQCTIRGGLFAPGIDAAAWVGIYRSSNVSEAYDGTVFEDVDINLLRTPSAAANSYGIDLGDGTSPCYGVIVQNCRVRGVVNGVASAIRGRQLRDALIQGNSIKASSCTGDEVSITARSCVFQYNRVVGGVVAITSDEDTTSTGVVSNNQAATFTITTGAAYSRWSVAGNGDAANNSLYGWSVTQGTATATATLIDNGNNVFSVTTSNDGVVTFLCNNDDGVNHGAMHFDTRNGATTLRRMSIDDDGYKLLYLPTSSAGLPSGALWNDGGTVKVA